MGFFNKKELERISELEAICLSSVMEVSKLNSKLNKLDALYIADQERYVSKSTDLKNKIKELEEALQTSTLKYSNSLEIMTFIKEGKDKILQQREILLEALKEIAYYDYDSHKKAYLLNDFFQERAKKALSEIK